MTSQAHASCLLEEAKHNVEYGYIQLRAELARQMMPIIDEIEKMTPNNDSNLPIGLQLSPQASRRYEQLGFEFDNVDAGLCQIFSNPSDNAAGLVHFIQDIAGAANILAVPAADHNPHMSSSTVPRMQWIGRETISSVAAVADAGIVVTPLISQRQATRENPPNQDEVYGGHGTLSDSAPRRSHNGRRSRERCGSPAATTSGVRPAAAPRAAGPPSRQNGRPSGIEVRGRSVGIALVRPRHCTRYVGAMPTRSGLLAAWAKRSSAVPSVIARAGDFAHLTSPHSPNA
jgi:hypothetical protein